MYRIWLFVVVVVENAYDFPGEVLDKLKCFRILQMRVMGMKENREMHRAKEEVGYREALHLDKIPIIHLQ